MFGFQARNRRIDEFGIQLADEVAKRLPLETKRFKQNTSEKYARVVDYALGLTVAFQRENRLGVYGKARLMNSFKWRLKQLGYAADFIDQTTAALATFAAARRSG